jgi:hypothetical protein
VGGVAVGGLSFTEVGGGLVAWVVGEPAGTGVASATTVEVFDDELVETLVYDSTMIQSQLFRFLLGLVAAPWIFSLNLFFTGMDLVAPTRRLVSFCLPPPGSTVHSKMR